jgi:hypothetical protein
MTISDPQTEPNRDPADRDSNVLWFAEQCRTNDVGLESLIKSAERAGDQPLADFFRRALQAGGRFPAATHAA